MGNKPSRLKVEDVNGTWAIIPTPAIAAGDDWRTEDSVDYDEVARADRIANQETCSHATHKPARLLPNTE